jgi:hypothetical protein
MSRLAVVLLGLTVPIAAGIGEAQSRSLSGARVHASVQIEPNDVFVYRYTVENGAGSTAGISRMTIDISLPVGASMPSTVGVAHGAGYFAESPAGRRPKAGATIPVGLSAPQGWRTTAGSDATARWVAANHASFVLQKQRLAGFSIESHGPPALRRFALAPYIDPDAAPVMEPGDDPGELDRYRQEFDQYVESQSTVGITLAPTALVTPTADGVLANLASEVTQARAQRWISNDASARHITERLQAARASLERRQPDTSANILSALRKEVAAQSGKALTSEAAALVDLTIQYALRRAAKP